MACPGPLPNSHACPPDLSGRRAGPLQKAQAAQVPGATRRSAQPELRPYRAPLPRRRAGPVRFLLEHLAGRRRRAAGPA
nr:hypothetical protein [Tanacetum cinerariifolium]